MTHIDEQEPLRYRGFLIYHNPDWGVRYVWKNPNYDGGTNDWGAEDTVEECVEQIDMFLEHNHVNYPDGDAWSGGFAENH